VRVVAAILAAGLALAACAYGRALSYPLLHDDRTLVASEWVAKRADLAGALRTDYWHGTRHEGSNLYRPLTIASIAWNAQANGSKEAFRAVNVALHLLAALAVFWLLAGFSHDRFASAAAAALFAVHPLGSEAVLWIVGRAEIQAALGVLVAMRLVLDHEANPKGWRVAGSALAFFLALLSKDSAVAAAVLIPAAWWALTPRRHPRMFLAHGAALAVYLALRGAAVGFAGREFPFVDNPLVAVDPLTRAANAIVLLGRYAGLAIWPSNLTVERGFDTIAVAPLASWVLPAAIAIVAAWVGAVLFAWRKGRRDLAVLVFAAGAAFGVTSNVFFPIGTIFAERVAYLPLAFACGIAGAGLSAIPRRAIAIALLGAACAAGAARTWVRAGDYRDLATLTEATAASSPRSVKALFNVGRTRLRTGRANEAIEPLERAVAILPDYPRAWATLAEAYAANGQPDKAREARERAGTPTSDEP
jgi:tetratricopeptide (TPR) repeat protein